MIILTREGRYVSLSLSLSNLNNDLTKFKVLNLTKKHVETLFLEIFIDFPKVMRVCYAVFAANVCNYFGLRKNRAKKFACFTRWSIPIPFMALPAMLIPGYNFSNSAIAAIRSPVFFSYWGIACVCLDI